MARGKILILGGSGTIGRVLAGRLGPQACLATCNSRTLPGCVPFDALTASIHTLDLTGISHAVVLLGNTNPDSCLRDPQASHALNVAAVTRLCDQLADRGIGLVFTSTDAVFDGMKGDYSEEDPANPLLLYGAQKVEVERHLADRWPAAAIIRLPKVYGSRPGDGMLLDGWHRQILRGESIRVADDFISSAIHVEDVATGLLACMDVGLSGYYHMGGPEGVSRLAMIEALIAAMGGDVPPGTQVIPCSIDDFPTLESRPKNNGLDCRKFMMATGQCFRPVAEAARQFAARARAMAATAAAGSPRA